MTDWVALAAEFLGAVKNGTVSNCLDESRGVSEAPTKLTKPPPVCDQASAEGVHMQKFDAPEVPTKPTKLPSGGVLSVLSVISEHDEFDDRVLCTDCHNYRYGHCHQHIRAGTGVSSEVGDLACLPQRCPAFEPKR